MAVDSRNKRFSMLGLALAFISVFPNPDGTLVAADRAQYLWLYPGISLSVVAELAADEIVFDLYIKQSMAFDSYIEQSRSFNLEK